MIHKDFKYKLTNLFPPVQADKVFSQQLVSVKYRQQTADFLTGKLELKSALWLA